MFQLCPIASGPVSVFFAPYLQVFICLGEIPADLYFLQAKQSQLSQPFLLEVLQFLKHLPGPFIGLSPVYPCLSPGSPELDTILQVWPHQQRGRIPSFDLLMILCLMQPRVLSDCFAARAHCWIVFNLVSTRTPKTFSVKLLCRWVAPHHVLVHGFVPSRCRTLHFLLNVMKFISTCRGPSGWQHDPLAYQPLFPVLCHLQTC